MTRIDAVTVQFTRAAGGQHRGSGKDDAQAVRIAGVITLYENPNAREIDAVIFGNACRLVNHYQSENIRLVGEAVIKITTMEDEERLIYEENNTKFSYPF